jgi:hypothetical protein
MTVKQVVNIISQGYLDTNCFFWNEETESFTDGNIEYQLRDYSSGIFKSILVRFLDDETDSYLEFYHMLGDIYELLHEAFSDETIEELDRIVCDKIKRKYNKEV